MQVQDLFSRDIFRPINGVVKADQLDESSVWQELDEFVVTKELGTHFSSFFSTYTDALDRPNDPDIAGKVGVWVSGFFGSGKSHFIKVLSYLLENAEHSHDGSTRRAVDFFEDKIDDGLLLADMQRSVASKVDVLLFNIDTKADHSSGRDAILQVFLKVLNESQGYSPDHPHIAHMERHLDSNQKLETFHQHYREATGKEWLNERDAYEFNRDEVIQAFCATLDQSEESAKAWIDSTDENFALTVENFCKWVGEYLDRKGEEHRIVFMADEVGQFIGRDTHLMLNLQTISEQLGTICGGRAWIIVTSQEDMDAVLGEMKTTRSNDFSKIQGRFKTRLSLSSSNVDEVIQSRLLSKKDQASDELAALYETKGDVLKNQLTFVDCGMTFRPFGNADEFAKNYPFIPYQFQLVQKIFEAIRKAGATGLHLAQGERSLLDAFQAAGQHLGKQNVGALPPLYCFYPSIESFLDTTVKRTIDQASENPDLEPFDIDMLKVLFLIRYVEEMKAKVDNLVTLCLDSIDADRLAIRHDIEQSLLRLEKQTLISRSGDVYSFLTNEERDISREIKNVDLSRGEEAKLLGELVYEDVLKGTKKHRYSANGMDHAVNRMCDRLPYGSTMDKALTVSIISPLDDEYDMFDNARCVLSSQSEHDGHVLIKLGNDESLGREIRNYLQTHKYVGYKDDNTLPETTRRILREFAEDNRQRRERLVSLVGKMFLEGDHYAAGQPQTIQSASPDSAFGESLEYLVKNTFTKMGHLVSICEHPAREIQAVLRSNDIEQQAMLVNLPESNPEALDDIKKYIDLSMSASRQVTLYDMIEGRYAKRPYGWPQLETSLLVARLMVLGEISLVTNGEPISGDDAYSVLTTPSKQRSVLVLKRTTADPAAIQNARNLTRNVFAEMGPDGEDALFTFIQEQLEKWKRDIERMKASSGTGKYPGGEELQECSSLVERLLKPQDSFQCIERFNEHRQELMEVRESYLDVEHFYNQQKPTFDKLQEAYARFEQNQYQLERDETAASSLIRMREILEAPRPYGLIKDVDGLISSVDSVNAALLEGKRSEAASEVQTQIEKFEADTKDASLDESFKQSCLAPLHQLLQQINRSHSIAHIEQAENRAGDEFDAAIEKVQNHLAKEPNPGRTISKRVTIKPADFAKSSLANEDDVKAFLDALGDRLRQALANDERIDIK